MGYVIIGNSAAGIGAVEGIRQVDRGGDITIVTNEPRHAYSRPLISYFISGDVDEGGMAFRPASFYEDNGCNLVYAEATGIEPEAKQVLLENGRRLCYDKLLVAAGSAAFVPPIYGMGTVAQRYTFMNMGDALALDRALDESKRVLILGAGLIGLKCAEGVACRASRVTVVDVAPHILTSVLDRDAAALVQTRAEARGVEFVLSAAVKRLTRGTAYMSGGGTIDFDILVLAAGVRPNTALLDGIADTGRGIVINERSETSAPDIYAAGDCTQTVDVSCGKSNVMAVWPNAFMQGECAGVNMAGGNMVFTGAMPMNAAKFFGLRVITAGSYNGDVYAAGGGESYKRLFFAQNRLNGFIMVGDVEKAGIYTSLIREGTPLDTLDFALICEKPGLMAFARECRALKLGGSI